MWKVCFRPYCEAAPQVEDDVETLLCEAGNSGGGREQPASKNSQSDKNSDDSDSCQVAKTLFCPVGVDPGRSNVYQRGLDAKEEDSKPKLTSARWLRP